MKTRHITVVLAASLVAVAALVWYGLGGDGRDEPGRRTAPAEVQASGIASVDGRPGADRAEAGSAPVGSREPAPAEAGVSAADESDALPPLACRVVRGAVGVPGCEVVLRDGDEILHTALTDADGRFALPRLGHMGSREVEIRTSSATLRAKGLARHRRFNGAEERVFHIGHGTLEVTVRDAEGRPAEGVRVAITVVPRALPVRYRCVLTTDARGRVDFMDLPPSRVSLSGGTARPNQVTLEIPEGAGSVAAELGPAPGAVPIVVRALAPDGTGLWSSIDVRVRDEASGRLVRADMDRATDGLYRLQLAPGTYRVESTPELIGSPATIEAGPGAPDVELRAPGAVVRGRLGNHTPRHGGPISRFTTSPHDAVLRAADTDEVVRTCRITDAGRFEFIDVPPGSYVLSGARGRLDPPMTSVPVAVTSRSEVLVVEGLRIE